MVETLDEAEQQDEVSAHSEAALPKGKQQLVAIFIAAAALVTVMLLMLLAVRRTSSAGVANFETASGDISPVKYARQIQIESYEYSLRMNVTNTRELEIKGYIRNIGRMAVRTADLRCYFGNLSGTETYLEVPLVIDSGLDDLGGGPLEPFSRRKFDVRVAEFPDELKPKILRLEVVNLSFSSL